MHNRVLGIIGLSLLTGCNLDLCFDPAALDGGGAGTVGTAKSPIVGGTLDVDNHSTVALLLTRPDGTRGLCSGTVIAKHGSTGYVLTAAHCATGTVDHVWEATDWKDCTPAGDSSKCLASYQPTSWTIHPSYDAATLVDDFAMVVFDGATPDTSVTPAVDVPDELVVGESVELSGFGRTYAGPDNPALYQTKRNHVTLPINALVSTSWIRFDATQGKTACFGDSGGPAFGMVGGKRRVVGVASAGDATCQQISIYGRVSSVYKDFIAPIIAPALAGDCNTCLQSSMRSGEVCDSERLACEGSSNCGSLLNCIKACTIPDQACYVACATPHMSGVPAFNALANCTACASCADACNVAACNGPSSSSSTTGAGGSASNGSSSSSASGGGQGGAGGAGDGGKGAGGDGGVSGSNAGGQGGRGVGSASGAGGATSGDGGARSGWLGAGGGFGGAASSSTAGGAPAASAPSASTACVPVNLKCSVSMADLDGPNSSTFGFAALGLIAVGVARTKTKRRSA